MTAELYETEFFMYSQCPLSILQSLFVYFKCIIIQNVNYLLEVFVHYLVFSYMEDIWRLFWRMACPHNMCFLLGLLPFLLFQFVAIKANVTLALTVYITLN